MPRQAARLPAVRVNPKLRSPAQDEGALPRIRLLIVADWDVARSPGLRGLGGLIRKRLISGERVLVCHSSLRLAPAAESERTLPSLEQPADPDGASVDGVSEFRLRLSLVRDLVVEGVPAFALSGVDLGLLRLGEDGALEIDASRLGWLLSSGVVPVIGSDCLSVDGTLARTCESEVIRALARSRDIHSLDVLTQTDRVLQFDGSEALALRLSDLERLRTRGPDHFPSDPVSEVAIEVALAALESGVPMVRIGSVASVACGTATEVTQPVRGVVVR